MSETSPVRVTLVATPETQVAPLSGLYEALTAFPLLGDLEPDLPQRPFDVRIAAPPRVDAVGTEDLRLQAHCTCDDVDHTDIAIVPLMALTGDSWERGRYPGVVGWLRRQHEAGAVLASACTGVLLLAETGILDGREATIHWAFADLFRRTYPPVRLRPEEVLITSGSRAELVMTGGVMSWHDLALHLVARVVGPTAAAALGRMLMLEWHGEGQVPYMEFSPSRDHGDGEIAGLQSWLEDNLDHRHPVDAMTDRLGTTHRTLERRFRAATGHSPIDYVQQLRVRRARRLLERTSLPVEQIGFAVGYQNTAYFRRLFQRTTRLSPAAYRRTFGRLRLAGDA